MKFVWAFVIFCAISSRLFAGDADPEKIIKEKLEIAKPNLQKAKSEYQKKVQVEISKIVKQLEEDLKKEMKNGNLEKANALKVAIDKIKAGKEIDELLNPPAASLLLGDKYVSILREFQGASLTPNKLFVLMPGQAIKSTNEYGVPIDIKYFISTTDKNLRIKYAGLIIFNWDHDRDTLRVDGGPVDNQNVKGAGRVPANKIVEIRQVVEKDKMTIFVDSKEVASWKADFSKIKQQIEIETYRFEASQLTVQDVGIKK